MKFLLAFWMCAAVGHAGTLQGLVEDSGRRPLAGALVYLQSKTMKTDAAGHFHFDGLAAGSYTVVVNGKSFGPFVVAEHEVKKVELALDAPAFFDEPKFVVAGVTAGTYQGGHGSDVILRSTEGLAKAAASLGDGGAGSASEKAGNALEAVREYQRAAEREPSERNLFDWGAELLEHRADAAAVEVFTKGWHLFPDSVRMTIGLAVALYAMGSYELAAQSFFAACDRNPNDPTPYLFLGKVQSTGLTKSAGYIERLARFAKLQPQNAPANYYYAAALWAQRNGPEDLDTPEKVKALLAKAIGIDPKLAQAHLLMGTVEFETADYARAISAFQKAVEVDPVSEEAHYRLAQAYRRTGESAKAQVELAEYEMLSKRSADEVQRERRDLQQFVIQLRTQ